MLKTKLKSLFIATLIFPLIFGGIFGVEKGEAATTPQITTGSGWDSLKLSFGDSGDPGNSIKAAAVISGTSLSTTFNKGSTYTRDQFVDSDKPADTLYTYDIRGYNLHPGDASVACTESANAVLVIWRQQGQTGYNWREAGVYLIEKGQVSNFRRVNEDDFISHMGIGFDVGGVVVRDGLCKPLSPFNKDFIRALNSSTFINTKTVDTTIDISDPDKVCPEMATLWDGIKNNMRKLFYSDVDSYWIDQESSSYGLRKITIAQAFSAIQSMGITALLAAPEIIKAMIVIDSTKQKVLNPNGVQLMNSTYKDAIQLKKYLDEFVKNGKPLSYCSKQTFTEFKFDETSGPGAKITDIKKFQEAVDKVVAELTKYSDVLGSPSSSVDPDELNSCGSVGIGNIIPWMLCNLGDMLHGFANIMTTKSVEYLKASIGIDISDPTSTSAPATTPATTP